MKNGETIRRAVALSGAVPGGRFRWWLLLMMMGFWVLGASAMAVADDALGGVARLRRLRGERDELLREANQAAASGDTRRGDAHFARVREINAMIVALRGELIRVSLAARQEWLQKRIGDLAGHQVGFHDPFLLVSPAHDAEFAKLSRYLPQAEKALRAQIGCRNLPESATVIIAGGDRSGLRELWRRVSGDEDLPSPETLPSGAPVIVADMRHGPTMLLAGMVQVLVKDDFPDAPEWLPRMLATLNETSRIMIDPQDGRARIEYPFNWRFAVWVERASATPAGPAIRALLTSGRGAGEDDAMAIARLRHWGLWLDRQGWLRTWYENFRDYRQLDPTGTRQLEQVAGRPLAQLLTEHEQWLQRQREQWREGRSP